MSISGAFQHSKLGIPYHGPVKPDNFSALKRTFSGHFHVHQQMDHNVVYVGSPLQFNCITPSFISFSNLYLVGDAGDKRGIVIYDGQSDKFEYVVSPHCNSFHKISDKDIETVEKNPEK